jgi:hypothetical protein
MKTARHASPSFAVFVSAVLFGMVFVGTATAQVSVSDLTGWNAWTSKLTNTYITDTQGDQQTGQGQDDFVGDATYAAFQQKAGTIGGTDYFLYRARMDKYDTNGFRGMLTLGIDLNNNGSIDLLMQMDDKSQTKGIWFATPGTGANDSPSTTSWGNFAGKITATTSTYNYMQATDTTTTFGANADAWVTFAISFTNLQNAIATYAPSYAATVGTITYQTQFSYIAFTTTQGNSINQDLLGVPKNYTTTTTYANLGVLTPPTTAWGSVPEPATYAQLGALLLAGGFVAYRRRSQRQVAAQR